MMKEIEVFHPKGNYIAAINVNQISAIYPNQVDSFKHLTIINVGGKELPVDKTYSDTLKMLRRVE